MPVSKVSEEDTEGVDLIYLRARASKKKITRQWKSTNTVWTNQKKESRRKSATNN